MQSNQCEIKSHNYENIIGICFDSKCQGRRFCCKKCSCYHNEHYDKLVDLNQIFSYFKTQCEKLVDSSTNVGIAQKNLQKVLQNPVEYEVLCLGYSNNFQQNIKGWFFNVKGEKEILENSELEQLVGQVLKVSEVQNGRLIKKDYSQFAISCQNHMDKSLFIGHSGQVLGIDICQKRNLLASGSEDFTVKLWNLVDASLIQTFEYFGEVYDVVISNNGKFLAFGGHSYSCYVNLVDISDLNRQNITCQLNGHTQNINRLAFTNSSNQLISGSDDGTVKIWDCQQKKIIFQLIQEQASPVNGIAIRADDNVIASNSSDGNIRIWDIKTQKLLINKHVHDWGAAFHFLMI